MKINKRELKLIIIAVVIIVSVSLLKYIILPWWNDYQSLANDIAEQKHMLKKHRLIVSRSSKVKERVVNLDSKLAAIDKLLFNQSQDQVKLKLLKGIDQEIKKSGLEIKIKNLSVERVKYNNLTGQLSQKKEKLLDRLEVIVYRLALKGDLSELVNLLNQINNKEKLYIIDRLEITPRPNMDQLLISLDIKVINRKGDIYGQSEEN